jgi:ribonuclease BN (tRNA processing enzyme)
MPHFTETYAIDVRSRVTDGRVVFGADTGPTDALVALGRDADLLFVEATLPRPEREGPRGHLTPHEAGEHAGAAGVRRLVLTHISDELDELWARQQARDVFAGPVDLAREGAVYRV